jgi:hypothetical protein
MYVCLGILSLRRFLQIFSSQFQQQYAAAAAATTNNNHGRGCSRRKYGSIVGKFTSLAAASPWGWIPTPSLCRLGIDL